MSFRDTLFHDYMIFSSAFAYMLAGNFQQILVSIIDHVLYPVIYEFTGVKLDEDLTYKINMKEVANKVMRFVMTIAVVYVAYVYKDAIIASIMNE